ncbi:hypothetical protein [Streptomyces sp. NPDC008092]|uniref:hypothetical protein n=1 Tax=Streptomyces sp. NPDC008092 TaxID=3364808 RepID=UPI0036EF6A02
MAHTDTGDTETDSAGVRLAELHHYFRQHPVTGPEGHSYTLSGNHHTFTETGIPYNVRVADHIQASVTEVITRTRDANPDAGLPKRIEDVYDWAREHTEHAPDDVRFRRDTLEYRHRLEHAIAAGDTAVVRPHRCPSCGTLGLHWNTDRQRAVCLNLHCARTNQGISRSWTLGRLAFERTATEKTLRECAT